MLGIVGGFKNRQRDERAGFAEQRRNDDHRFDRRAYEENRPQVIWQNLQIRRDDKPPANEREQNGVHPFYVAVRFVVFSAKISRNGDRPDKYLPENDLLYNKESDVNRYGNGENGQNRKAKHNYVVRLIGWRFFFAVNQFVRRIFPYQVVHRYAEQIGNRAERDDIRNGRAVFPFWNRLVGIGDFLAEFRLFHSACNAQFFNVFGYVCFYLIHREWIVALIADFVKSEFKAVADKIL